MMRAIYVLWTRQLKRYWRSKPRMIASLGQPLLFLLALGFGLGPIYQKASGGNFIDFLTPGIVSMAILFSAMFNGMEVIWDRQFGFLKETLVAPVSRLSIMFGRVLGGATISTIQGAVVLIISIFLLHYRPESWLALILALVIMFLIAMLFTAFGIAIASKLEDMQAFPLIMNFIIMPLFFLSGALFPLESVSPLLLKIAQWNPLTYGVEALRWALTGMSHFNITLSLAVLASSVVIIGVIGSYFFSKIEA